jgi:hypothetical protein
MPMRIRTPLVLLAAVLTATGLVGQEAPPRPSPKPAPGKAAPAPEAKTEKEAPRREGQLANVRIDVRIIDERGGQPAMTKAVSLTVADRRNGFIRSSAEAPFGSKTENLRSIPLNVDASPLIEGGRIRLDLGLEYNFVDTSGEAKQYPKIEIRDRLSLVLDDGKPLRVAQSADPLSDRRVSLEVTATILR